MSVPDATDPGAQNVKSPEYPALNAGEYHIEIGGERVSIASYTDSLGVAYFAVVRGSEPERAYIVTRDGAIWYTRKDNTRAVEYGDAAGRGELRAMLARVGFAVPEAATNADSERDRTYFVRHFNHTERGAARLLPR